MLFYIKKFIKCSIIIFLNKHIYIQGDNVKITCIYKRLMLVSIFIFISFSIYGIINIVKKNEKTLETNALPVTNKVIIIDAGHGKPDEGASLLHKENKQLTFYK